jgi:flagellar hook-basal body complex protein FliE
MINLNANVAQTANSIKRAWDANSAQTTSNQAVSKEDGGATKPDFANTVKAVEKYISNVDNVQQASDVSIKDLLSGKNQDITSVVSAVAKADISFKLLVGVRNKLIEAYKQTMNMPL